MKSFVALVVLLALFASGEAVKCYSCMSQSNSTCGDPFTKSKDVKELPDTKGCICAKIVVELSNATTFVKRDCISAEFDTRAFGATIKNNVSYKSVEANFCDKDFCNGASSFAGALFTTMGLAMTVLVAKLN